MNPELKQIADTLIEIMVKLGYVAAKLEKLAKEEAKGRGLGCQ